ncbi:MAG: hypothetical protein ABJB05_07550 [Parafilimonas sp.]
MSHTIKTSLLQYEKSIFKIELLEHENGNEFIQIEQIIDMPDQLPKSQTIKINPVALDDILKELVVYKEEIKNLKKQKFSTEIKKEIARRYLKGLDLTDLAIQFNCSENLIKEILQDQYIEIVSNKLSAFYFGRYERKKRKP